MNLLPEEEIEFLRDQLYRLNGILSQYQSKYPPLKRDFENGPFPTDGPAPKWLTDKALVSPLLEEYDAQIKNLRDRVEAYYEERMLTKRQLETLLEENQKLTRDLKDQVQLHLDALNDKTRTEDASNTASSGFKYQEVVDNMQEQLVIVAQERDQAGVALQDAMAELDKLKSLRDQEFLPHYKELERKYGLVIDQYGRSIAALNTDLNEFKLRLDEREDRVMVLEAENAALLNDLDRLKSQLDQRRNEMEFNDSGNADLRGLIDAQEEVIAEFRDKHQTVLEEYQKLNNEKTILVQRRNDMSEKIMALETQHANVVERLKANVQLTDDALLEKDRAFVKVRQLEEEVQLLKSSLGDLVREAGVKTKKEVEEIRAEAAAKYDKIADHLAKLEDELRDRTGELERVRLKLQERKSENRGSDDERQRWETEERLDKLRDRLQETELQRDQLEGRLEEVEAELKATVKNHGRFADIWRQKEEKLNGCIEDLFREADRAREDQTKIQAEKLNLTDKIARLKSEASTFENRLATRDAAHAESLRELDDAAKQRLRVREEEYRIELDELRRSFSKDHRAEETLREEHRKKRLETEARLEGLKKEREALKKGMNEVEAELRDENSLRMDLETRLVSAERKMAIMEEKIRGAEGTRDELNLKLVDKMKKENEQIVRMRKLENDMERWNVKCGLSDRLFFPDSSTIVEETANEELLKIFSFSENPGTAKLYVKKSRSERF